ncbi:DUF2334 domain-containing protein [Ramlibacter sp.]|uniref:DUF2334 domain-containing protein n=1 Tax=Ramlibacter sp. TaxID=1917967 RepID=UPI0026223EF1|nr:DUF2334 domain-containing protein [Ramlibacter sp.]MDB5958127.1 hypothetical protein [Ramlibacter sp.]
MKVLVRYLVVLAWMICICCVPAQAQTPPPPKVLVLYDTPTGTTYDKIGFAYSIMLRNLLGHFDAQVTLAPVAGYTAGTVNAYDATFYLGSAYDFQLPAAFLGDAASTAKTLVWFRYNIWQLAWNPAYNFTATRGVSFSALRGMNAAPSAANPTPGFFDTIQYKGKAFVKYYTFNSDGTVSADPDVGITAIADPTKATTLVTMTNPKTKETAPYVVRSGNFWYVADAPLSFIGPRDRYLVLADLLHDMLGSPAAESHKAMIRLEDVNAWTSVASMKTLTDYLHVKAIPFSIATIPHFTDALGIYNNGVPLTIPLSQASNLKKELNYALARGGEVVMHGYTHQYAALRNPYDAVSGDDYEMWNIVANSPVAEDSQAWALGRLRAGLTELQSNGYTPVAWEMPHYQGSAAAYRATPQVFPTTYQRVVYYTSDTPNFTAAVGPDMAVGQFYPYIINQDYYGQRVLPENLGNFEYALPGDPTANVVYTGKDILTNAQYALTVRDGFGSFFFHPFLLEPAYGLPALADLKALVTAMTKLGYTWVAPSGLR